MKLPLLLMLLLFLILLALLALPFWQEKRLKQPQATWQLPLLLL
jgi:hypothetical protein